ncbi:hypothetical protein ILYODFUR_037164 [Ilyodon furcidens]|uniref:Uncharacterized protein n=1 Tax=Ilyodon furcidens TaxID=33524 RepID=A0ABV0SS93_9TELE
MSYLCSNEHLMFGEKFYFVSEGTDCRGIMKPNTCTCVNNLLNLHIKESAVRPRYAVAFGFLIGNVAATELSVEMMNMILKKVNSYRVWQTMLVLPRQLVLQFGTNTS